MMSDQDSIQTSDCDRKNATRSQFPIAFISLMNSIMNRGNSLIAICLFNSICRLERNGWW